MNDFERAIVGDLPLSFKADAWFSVKHAAIGDPPDTTGAIEGQFPVPVAQVLEGLAEMVKAKMTIMYAYATYAQTIRGPFRGELAENFQEFAEDDLEDLEWYLRRMSSLGGGAHLPEIDPPPATTDPIEAIKITLRLEQETVAKLAALRNLVGDNPMKFDLEAFMAEEQMHVDRLWQLLPYEADPEEMAEQDGKEPLSMEQKAASMRMRVGFMKLGEGMSRRELKRLQREQEDIHELRGSLMASSSPETKAYARKKKVVGALSGGLKGGLLGTGIGAAIGYGTKRGPRAAKALAALGGLGGAAVGGTAGHELAGAQAHKTISKAAMIRNIKLAFDDMAQGDDNLAASAAHGDNPQGDSSERINRPPMVDPTRYLEGTGVPGVDPALSDYIEKEREGQDAEERASSDYYRQVADMATQEAQAAQSQLGEVQQQAMMAQQQAAALQQQVQDTQQQAQAVQQQAVQTAAMAQSTAANSQAQAIKAMQDVLLHKQLAANMRQGVLAMKDQIQSVLMSDPTAGAEAQIAGPPPGPPPGSPGGEVPSEGSPPPEQGPAAGSPAPPTAPAGGPTSSGQPPGQVPGQQGQATPEQKQASAASKMLEVAKKRAPYAVPGALLAGGLTYASIKGGATKKLQEKVDEQKRKSKRGELGTSGESELARDKMRLAYSEFADKNPRAATATGAAIGAGAAAAAGPPLKTIGKFVKTRLGRR